MIGALFLGLRDDSKIVKECALFLGIRDDSKLVKKLFGRWFLGR